MTPPLWLYEDGIGEERALLSGAGGVISGILAVRRQRKDDPLLPGAIVEAQLSDAISHQARHHGRTVQLHGARENISEGETLKICIDRAALHEHQGDSSRYKLARGKAVASSTALRPAQTLKARLQQTGFAVEQVHNIAGQPDRLADAGWHEAMEAAQSGHIPFPGGALWISDTPAMTVIDVDGTGTPAQLAQSAATACAMAIELFALGGSIVIDFPTLERRSERKMIDIAFDDAMIGDYERTATNGFGLMQIVRQLQHPSIINLYTHQPEITGLLDNLRHCERDNGTADIALRLNSRQKILLEHHNSWRDLAAKRTGRAIHIVDWEPHAQ